MRWPMASRWGVGVSLGAHPRPAGRAVMFCQGTDGAVRSASGKESDRETVDAIDGCEHSGHRASEDCFVKSRAHNGDVTMWNDHGMVCAMCLAIARARKKVSWTEGQRRLNA